MRRHALLLEQLSVHVGGSTSFNMPTTTPSFKLLNNPDVTVEAAA
jgi:hypothetical protein